MTAPTTPASRKPLILVVDDVPANLHVIASALRDDYRIKTATNGPGALALASRVDDRPDLILLDVMMPMMSGHDVLRELRDGPETRDIPVIFVTADTSEDNEIRGLGLGACDFLPKPINVRVLRARVRNLLQRQSLQRMLQLNELKLRAMLDSSMQFIALLDTNGLVLHVNRQVRELLARPLEAVLEQPFWKLPLWSDFTAQQDDVRHAVERAARGVASRFETLYADGADEGVVLDFSLHPVRGTTGQVTFLLAEATDMTRQRTAENNIRHLANNDPLTGLPNRILLSDRVNQAIRLAERHKTSFALMFLDLDRFKHINDTLGHAHGDKLLIEMGRRLAGAVRLPDTVARIGGDEFVLLLPDTPAAGAITVAEKLLSRTVEPCTVEMHKLAVTASIGIAMYPDDGRDFETLSKCADTAMYRAKREGRNGYRFFTQEMHERSARLLHLESLLRHAAERGELHLHYQPQIDLESGLCVGAEALLRWTSPELGEVSPGEMIPVAEETGLILQIGEWVLRTACRQARAWMDAGFSLQTVAVNVSSLQLRQRDFQDAVTRCLEDTGVPAERLELEITESAAFGNLNLASTMLDPLHDRGVRLSLDDFGTGYSSLSYLRRIHIDKLKIDQSFVRELTRGPEDQALIAAMVNMARTLKLRTVAEGVETREQLEALRALGCDEVQGYHLGRPMAAERFEAWMTERKASGRHAPRLMGACAGATRLLPAIG